MNPGLYFHEHHSLRLSVMKHLAFGLDLPIYIQHISGGFTASLTLRCRPLNSSPMRRSIRPISSSCISPAVICGLLLERWAAPPETAKS